MPEDLPIILLSGMAADHRLFASQLATFPTLRVQPWIAPQPGESLCGYAARLAPVVDPGRPCLVGGASFGGLVALELAPHLSALGCILIGSIRTPLALPRWWRVVQPLAAFGPDVLGKLAAITARVGAGLLPRATVRRLRRLAQPEAVFVRWAICAVLRWRPSSASRSVRVFHIHGAADRVLPVELVRPDRVVPGGAHALSLFNPAAVNEFINQVLREASTSVPRATGRPFGYTNHH